MNTYVGSPVGVLGDQPFIRSTKDLQDQVTFGCSTTELYNKDVAGVLDSGYYGERSPKDKAMLAQFGCGGSSENYNEKQRQALNFAQKQKPIEPYCASCNKGPGNMTPFAKTSDSPTNPWSSYSQIVAMRP
jgi:hypothetical protein